MSSGDPTEVAGTSNSAGAEPARSTGSDGDAVAATPAADAGLDTGAGAGAGAGAGTDITGEDSDSGSGGSDESDGSSGGDGGASGGFDESKYPYGCEHYRRSCKLVAPCCGLVTWCRLCHDVLKDEEELDVRKAHKMDRHAVTHVECAGCGLRQQVCKHCSCPGDVHGVGMSFCACARVCACARSRNKCVRGAASRWGNTSASCVPCTITTPPRGSITVKSAACAGACTVVVCLVLPAPLS